MMKLCGEVGESDDGIPQKRMDGARMSKIRAHLLKSKAAWLIWREMCVEKTTIILQI